jgi:membrane associated rhomboid family serine protease
MVTRVKNGVIVRDGGLGGGFIALRALGLLFGLLLLLNPNDDSLRLFLRAQRNTSTLGQLQGAIQDLTTSWLGAFGTTDEVDWHQSYFIASLGASGKRVYVGALGMWFEAPTHVATMQNWGDAVVQDEVRLIAFINVFVFMLWQCLPLQLMRDHFIVSRRNLRACRVHCLLTSVFSQESVMHLVQNLMFLLSRGPEVQRLIPQHFLFLYLGGGCFGAMLSALAFRHHESCGASPALYALLAFNAFLHPNREYALAGFELTAVQLMWTLLAMDFLSYTNGDAVDYASHAGGAMFGAGFCAHLKHVGGVFGALRLWINAR